MAWNAVRWMKVAPVGAAFVVFGAWGCAPTGSPASRASVQEHAGDAQGTTYLVKYLAEERLPQSELDSILRSVDEAVNLWWPTSVISQVNAWDRLDTVFAFTDASFVFSSLWLMSEQLHAETGGAFDPTVLPLVELWGFGLSERGQITPAQVDSVRALVGMSRGVMDVHHVERNRAIASTHVRKRFAGAKLDFNSIAQGFTVDLVTEWLLDAGIANAMVEIGGEVRCVGVNDRGEPWHIAIDQPILSGANDRQLEAIIAVSDMAVCTSGSYRKFYEEDGIIRSHTIDPVTGYPVNHGLLSATVRARTAATADALATACMVLGPDAGRDFVISYQQRHPEESLEAVFLIAQPQGGWETWMSDGWDGTLISLREPAG